MPAGERLPRVRFLAVPDGGVFVVRGDELDPRILAEDAERFRERFPDWGRYGVSAFYAATDSEVDALCESKLGAFATVATFHRSDLQANGLLVVPTFRTPHVTICHEQLDQLIHGILTCQHTERNNPYHEPDKEG